MFYYIRISLIVFVMEVLNPCVMEVQLTPPHQDLNPTLASAARPPASSLVSQFGCATPAPEQEENNNGN